MKYISFDEVNHKIIIIPRNEDVIDYFELYHELNDKTYQINDFEYEYVNGYLEITFTHTVKQGNIFVYKAKSNGNLIATGKIEVI